MLVVSVQQIKMCIQQSKLIAEKVYQNLNSVSPSLQFRGLVLSHRVKENNTEERDKILLVLAVECSIKMMLKLQC
jgi:hypothetical protein